MQSFQLAKNTRECKQCGYRGEMKTWFDHFLPLVLAFVLLCLYVVPGLLLIAWGWGKYKCPNCGNLGNNVPTVISKETAPVKCPYCAEDIKREAIVCKHCGRDVAPLRSAA